MLTAEGDGRIHYFPDTTGNVKITFHIERTEHGKRVMEALRNKEGVTVREFPNERRPFFVVEISDATVDVFS